MCAYRRSQLYIFSEGKRRKLVVIRHRRFALFVDLLEVE